MSRVLNVCNLRPWLAAAGLLLSVLLSNSPAVEAADPIPTGFRSRVYVDRDQVHHKYVIFIPPDYDPEKPLPIILSLHGAGERGDNGFEQVISGLGRAIYLRFKKFPFVVVFPQCEVGMNWSADRAASERALEMLRLTQKELKTDPDRVYLTGISMGGHGSWQIAAKYPEMFAAVVPMCADKINLDDAPKLAAARLPIWNFCGDLDEESTVTVARQMHDALTKSGGRSLYTEYPGVKHNCWDQAYATDALYTWLLEQSRSKNQAK